MPLYSRAEWIKAAIDTCMEDTSGLWGVATNVLGTWQRRWKVELSAVTCESLFSKGWGAGSGASSVAENWRDNTAIWGRLSLH